jgi:hypothetical protein
MVYNKNRRSFEWFLERLKADPMQLEFKCPECGVSGLTPEIPEEKAIAVTLKELSIRCPCCSAVIEITESLGRVMLRTPAKIVDALAENAGESVSRLVHEIRKAELERRSAKPKRRGAIHPVHRN